MSHLTPPIDQIAAHIIMVCGSAYWKFAKDHVDADGRCYWTLWNEMTGNLEVWVARQAVTIKHIDEISALAQRLTIEMNSKPVSTVTEMDVPTFGEMYALQYVGVIVTCAIPLPDVFEYSGVCSDVYTIILSPHQIQNAVLEMRLLDEAEDIERAN